MVKKILSTGLLVSVLILFSGCIAVLAGGGTALWQAGKVISEESVSMERGASAAEAAFRAKGITLTDRATRDEVTQIRGEDKYDNKVAVDIFSKGPKNIRVEIRYGLGEETPARELMNELKRRL